MKIYEINEELRRLLETTNEDGLIEPEAFDRIIELQATRGDKMEWLGLHVKELRAEAQAVKAEADALYKRATSASKRADGIENYLTFLMTDGELDKFQTNRLTLSFRSSKAVEVTSEALIPKEYFRIKREPDKVALSADLKAGKEIPGAALVERRRIQVK